MDSGDELSMNYYKDNLGDLPAPCINCIFTKGVITLNLLFMDINYTWVGLVGLIAICLVIFLIVRNRKDQKDFEEDANQADVTPGQHDDENERL